jgi:hypothetical protein
MIPKSRNRFLEKIIPTHKDEPALRDSRATGMPCWTLDGSGNHGGETARQA